VSAPFYEFGAFGEYGALVAALVIGIAFGAALERAGLGSAGKLAGQFYLTDFTVIKVMFTAIVTAMLGVFWLGRLGVLDVARVAVPETWAAPQLLGGAVFGIGFVLAGLCPGTSCVAAATGRLDGAMTVAGMFTGALLTGLFFAPLQHLYAATPLGIRTLPQALHASYGTVVAAVVLLALATFAVSERLEARHREQAP
jgi:uncharacterized membrane protein YedE/YeeE